MRNCFTKITNMFRKKPIQTQPDSSSLDGEEFLQQQRQNEGAIDDNEFRMAISYAILSDCTTTNDDYKQPGTLNNHDNNNDDDSKDKREYCDKNFNCESVIEHQKISNSNVLNKQKIIGTPSLGVNVVSNGASGNVKNYFLSKPLEKKPVSQQNLCLHVGVPESAPLTRQNLSNEIENSDSETKKLLQQTGTMLSLKKLKEYHKHRLLKNEQQQHSEPQRQDEQSNENNLHISLANGRFVDKNTIDRYTDIQDYESLAEINKLRLNYSQFPPSQHLDPDLFSTKEDPYHPTVNANNKTLEEIEYDARIADERGDIMTPLPTDTLVPGKVKHHQHQQPAFGRTIQPEIIEVIRNLDDNTLRINNLTVNDKFDLLRRYEDTNQYSQNSDNRIPSNNSSLNSDQQQQRLHSQLYPSESVDSNDADDVILRRSLKNESLYERRQPKSPKLKLHLESKNSGEIYSTRLAKKYTNNVEVGYLNFQFPFLVTTYLDVRKHTFYKTMPNSERTVILLTVPKYIYVNYIKVFNCTILRKTF